MTCWPSTGRARARRSPSSPWPDGERRMLWTTFTAAAGRHRRQPPAGARPTCWPSCGSFAEAGIRMVRLDAVGYAIKKPGDSCFMMPRPSPSSMNSPRIARGLGHGGAGGGAQLLPQADRDRAAGGLGVRLRAAAAGAACAVLRHCRAAEGLGPQRPANAITVLDTHDGIGIIDIGADATDRAGRPGLVPPAELDQLVEMHPHPQRRPEPRGHRRGRQQPRPVPGELHLLRRAGPRRCAYLLARAIQFFLPGVPQVYYVGLLAGENDMALLQAQRRGPRHQPPPLHAAPRSMRTCSARWCSSCCS
jgi:sucrose phosphorylase